MQLEACRIPGVLICSKGRLVFSSKDVHLKLPTHLGGPGGSDILSLSAQKTSQHSYLECMLTCDPLNSGTIPDLSYWPVGNRSNFSCQSLLSTHENRKLCIGETSPSSLRKRGLKQFLTTLLSKKPKQNRNPFEGVSTGCSSGQADVAARGLSATYHHVSTATAGDTKDGAETLRLDWPLTTLRQFAFRGCLFKMETGRRAPHGEGHYLFRVKDIGEFRQTLEAHIKSHKRTRALKTLSAVCYPAPCRLFPPSIPPPPPPPPPTAPPPPPASVTDSQAYVNLPPLPQPLSRSWSHLVESSEEETARVLAEEPLIHHEDDDDDVEWQVGCLPPPPPPGADLIPATNDLVPVTPSSTPQGRVIRVGTYENVRTLLQSNGDLPRSPSRSAVESCLELHTPNEASTINYALLEFQPPAASPPHSGQSSVQNVAAVGVLVPSSNRSVLTRTSSVRSRPRPSRLLVRSVGDGLNTLASSATAAVPPGVTTSGQAAANYVDICPLQTLAINELLRTTL
ncbi:unnamed protein product [Mesocestoides corti]|nr:unnamed protein product [Mesocestoides corti]